MNQAIVGCPVPEPLSARTQQMIDDLRAHPQDVARGDVVDLVVELTDASFQYHFVRPLQELGVGFTTRKGIDVGLKGAAPHEASIRPGMQKVVKSMDDAHYAKLADFIEEAYFPAGAAA